MTRAVGDDDSMLKSLQEVVALFKEAQNSVFKLMSSVRVVLVQGRHPLIFPQDSVPKFLKEPRYAQVLREQNFENMLATSQFNAPSSSTVQRSGSRAVRD